MSKQHRVHQEHKLLVVLSSGRAVTIEEIESTLGKEIEMYRLSTYIWRLKKFAGAIITAHRQGRKVVSYQVMNPEAMQTFLKSILPAGWATPVQSDSVRSTVTESVTDTVSV